MTNIWIENFETPFESYIFFDKFWLVTLKTKKPATKPLQKKTSHLINRYSDRVIESVGKATESQREAQSRANEFFQKGGKARLRKRSESECIRFQKFPPSGLGRKELLTVLKEVKQAKNWMFILSQFILLNNYTTHHFPIQRKKAFLFNGPRLPRDLC